MNEVIRIAADRVEEAGMAMAEAFMDDPFCRFVIKDESARPQLIREMFMLTCRSRIEKGEILLGVEDAGKIGGVIAASGPDAIPFPRDLQLAWEAFSSRVGSAGSERFDRYIAEEKKRRSPKPQIHVNGLAVIPALQGRGIGARLLQAVIQISEANPDSEGVGLDTATLPNVRFYERRGFRTRSHVDLGGCKMWFMFRADRFVPQ